MTRITDAMMVFAAISLGLIAKMIYLAYSVRDTNPTGRLIVTQRLRYGWLLASGVLTVGLFVWMLHLGSFSELQAGAAEWMAIDTLTGYLVGISSYMLLYGAWAGLAALTVICVYRKPAAMAFRVLGRFMGFKRVFITTASKRLGKGHWIPVTAEIGLDNRGYPTRRFVETAPNSDNSYGVYDSMGRPIGTEVTPSGRSRGIR